MIVTQSTPTSQGRIWPTFISSIVDYLPSLFSRESTSTTGASGSLCKDKISTGNGSRALIEVQEAKEHSPALAASESSLCQDAVLQTQSKNRTELSRRVRSMLRKAMPDKESVYIPSQSRNDVLTASGIV